MGRRLLMTGGSGLVGRTLVPLLRDGWQITHLDAVNPDDGLPWIHGDLRDPAAVKQACQGIDAIVHIAALHGRAWAAAGDQMGFQVNVTGTLNVLEAAVSASVGRVVFTSSIWATGHGSNPPYLPIDEDLPREPAEMYGLTKILGEQLCRYVSARHGLSTIVLRPGGIMPAKNYKPLTPALLGGCVDVRDVAAAHKLALEASADLLHERFIITADSPLCRVAPAEYRAAPSRTLARLVPAAQVLLDSGELKPSPDMEWYSIAKARRILGYCPRYNFGGVQDGPETGTP